MNDLHAAFEAWWATREPNGESVALQSYTAGCERATPPASLLQDILEYLESRADVRDGSDRKQLPNDAMILAIELKRYLPHV